MSEYNCVGVDVAKDHLDVAILGTKKVPVKRFKNDIDGHKRLYKWLNKHTENPWVGMESTGIYSTPLAEFMFKQGVRVSIINAMQVKHFAIARLTRNKTDQADARVIAEFVHATQHSLRCYKPKSPIQIQLGDIMQLIDQYKEQVTRLKNKKISLRSEIAIQDSEDMILYIEKRIKDLNNKLKAIARDDEEFMHNLKLLTSIKGVGELTARRLLIYLPNIENFDNAKQLAAFIGVCPRLCQSGLFKGKTKISKFGHKQLRSALYMPALVAKNHNDGFCDFVGRLEKKGMNKKAIICAVLRKLVHVIFGVLKNNTTFDPSLCSKQLPLKG